MEPSSQKAASQATLGPKILGQVNSTSEANDLIESGYVLHPKRDLIHDRYYAGSLVSTDNRTRFRAEEFRTAIAASRSRVWTKVATSMSDVAHIVEAARSATHRDIYLRGQTAHFSLARKIPNPGFVTADTQEVSLIPSLYRRMLKHRPYSFHYFQNLSELEWSSILYSSFDLPEIERRQAAMLAEGKWVYSISDMEDCDDPVVSAFGKLRGDLLLKFPQLMASLATVLQHYGLLSPVLDLTSDLDVATFFATHAFAQTDSGSMYRFVGTNQRQGVVYLLHADEREIAEYDRKRIFDVLKPARPERQSCVISSASPWALNLPADFLVGVVRLDFDITEPVGLRTKDLFPAPSEDVFLRALVSKSVPHVTVFDQA